MRKKKFNVTQFIIIFCLTIFLILTLFPFYVMIVNSFKTPQDYLLNPINIANPVISSYYKFAWEKVRKYFVNTIIIAVVEIILQTTITSMAAYGFTRFKFKGKKVLFMLVLAVTMVPGVLTLIPSYVLVYNMGLTGSLFGVFLPQLVAPFNIFLLKSFFEGIPKEIYESAELDGASNFKMFMHISLPLSKPILFTIGLTTLMGCWNDLIWPRLILGGEEELYTISVGIMELTNAYGAESFGMGVPLAAYCIVSIPLLIAFFATSKQFISGLTSGAIKM